MEAQPRIVGIAATSGETVYDGDYVVDGVVRNDIRDDEKSFVTVQAVQATTPVTVADKLKEYALAINRQLKTVVNMCCIDSVEIKKSICGLIDTQIDLLTNMNSVTYLQNAMNATMTVNGTGILRDAKDQIIDFMIAVLQANDEEENCIDLSRTEKETGEIVEEGITVTDTRKLKEYLPIVEEVLQDSIIATFMTQERREIASLVLNLNFTTNLRQLPILSLVHCIENYLTLLKEIEERVTGK